MLSGLKTDTYVFIFKYSQASSCFFLKIELNLPRHVRDEVLTRSC